MKARYPALGAKPGGSDFLRKRLTRGVGVFKVFNHVLKSPQSLHFNILDLVPQQKYFDSGDYNMAKAKMKNKQLPSAPTEKTEITGGHIPTPQDLPQRKTSIVTSKLVG